jgi:hypothetical protein
MNPEETVPSIQHPIDQCLSWYENQPWLRALVQMVPLGGGSIDTLLAWRGTQLNQQRIDELLANISEKLSDIAEDRLRQETIQSEEFFDVFRTCAETAAHTASKSKRELLADFLAGTIRSGLGDLSSQFAEDLKVLQEMHLYVLANLPHRAPSVVPRNRPRKSEYDQIDDCCYEKVIADLERLGFISKDDSEDMWDEHDGACLFTTKYMERFMHAITRPPVSVS